MLIVKLMLVVVTGVENWFINVLYFNQQLIANILHTSRIRIFHLLFPEVNHKTQ